MWASIALNDLHELITPAALVLGGFIAGLLVERVIIGALRRGAARTEWEGDEILLNGLRGIIVTLFILIGLRLALPAVHLNENYTAAGERIIAAAFVLLATVALNRISIGFVELYASGIPGIQPSTSIFTNITKVIVWVIGILVALQIFGISITPMLTALGVGGLGVALALQDTLSNLFSGLTLIAARQIQVGDYIELETGQAGHVADITWRNTTIRSLPNNMVIVPNAALAKSVITNYNQPEQQMSVLVQVGVGYASDLGQVEKVTIDVAKKVMGELVGDIPGFEPFIRYHTFGESSIDFSVILRVKEFGDQYVLKHEFIKQLQARFAKEGIEIPFPIRTVHLDKQQSPN
jgi:small-conductance mechanosensitive channel